MPENIPNVMNGIKPQILETIGIKQHKHKEYCAKAHKMEKTMDKEKILKVARWKRCIGTPQRHMGFVPHNRNKMNILIKQVKSIFWFLSVYKSYVYTVLQPIQYTV